MLITQQLGFVGKVAVVTGGGTGIGYATAWQLAEAFGAAVVIASRTESELTASADRIARETSGKCLAIPTDVKSEDAVIYMIRRAVEEFGRVDVLINNAGGTRMGPLEKHSDPGLGLRLRAHRALGIPVYARGGETHDQRRRSGAIVNISSNAGMTGVKGGSALLRCQIGAADVYHRHCGGVGTLWHPCQLRSCRSHCVATRSRCLEGCWYRSWNGK